MLFMVRGRVHGNTHVVLEAVLFYGLPTKLCVVIIRFLFSLLRENLASLNPAKEIVHEE